MSESNLGAGESYAARICWNSHGWREPTGEAAKLESGSYVAEHGFGHEEWLLDPSAGHKGWQYGFLQPVSKSRHKLRDRMIDVRLYAISDEGWFYVGRLPACEILSDEEATAACERFSASGRLERMKAQVRQVGGDPSPLDTERPWWLANIRWRPETTDLFDPLIPMPGGHRMHTLPRYSLTRLAGDSARALSEWPRANRPSGLLAAHVWPDEVDPTGTYEEGNVRVVRVNAYERDPRARAACLAHYGPACFVCGMEFAKRYGPGFAGVIHVHHLHPLAGAHRRRRVDPVKDLRPLCPNCHAAVHQRDPPHAPEELRNLMERERG